MICRLVDTRACEHKTTKHNTKNLIFGQLLSMAVPSFVVNGRSFDHDLDFDVLLGRRWPSLLRLFDGVQHAVVLCLPVPLLDVHVHIHILKSKLVFVIHTQIMMLIMPSGLSG